MNKHNQTISSHNIDSSMSFVDNRGDNLQILSDASILFVLIISVILRITLVTGPVGSDDINYFHYSQQLLHWEKFTTLHHHGGRLFFLATIGVPAALVGSIYAGAVLNVLVISLRDIIVVLYLRKRLGATAALSGGGILAFNSLTAIYSGLMLPDGLLSLLMFLSAVLAFESVSAVGKPRLWMIFGSGFFAWAGYSVKDTGILIIPCVVLWLLAAHSRWKLPSIRQSISETGLFLGSFSVFVLFEMFVYYLLSGDPLYRFHALSWTHNTVGDVAEAASLYDYLRNIYWNLMRVMTWDSGSLPVLLVAAVIWSVSILKMSRFSFFALTGSFLSTYLIFGSSSMSRLIPLPLQDRYLEIIIPFLAVPISGLVGSWQSPRRKFAASIGISLLMGLISAPSIAEFAITNGDDRYYSGMLKNCAVGIRALQHAQPPRQVYVSPNMHWRLEPFLEPTEYDNLRLIATEDSLPSGFYLLNPERDINSRYSWFDYVRAMPTYFAIGRDQSNCTVKYFDQNQLEAMH